MVIIGCTHRVRSISCCHALSCDELPWERVAREEHGRRQWELQVLVARQARDEHKRLQEQAERESYERRERELSVRLKMIIGPAAHVKSVSLTDLNSIHVMELL